MYDVSGRTLEIVERPFAADPDTYSMNFDGIFDVSMDDHKIGVYFTIPKEEVETIEPALSIQTVGWYWEIKAKAPPGSGIVITEDTVRLGPVKSGKFLGFFRGSFRGAKIGKHILEFECIGNCPYIIPYMPYHPEPYVPPPPTILSLKREIFVVETSVDPSGTSATVKCPQGDLKLELKNISVFRDKDWFREMGYAIALPRRVRLEMTQSFQGQFSELPFQDPAWWKVLAAIVCFALLIADALYARSHPDQPNPWRCTVDDEWGNQSCGFSMPDPDGDSVRQWLNAFATLALGVALSDEKDPFRKGEENTKPEPDERTKAEIVEAVIEYEEPPNLGTPYVVDINWSFERITTGKTYKFSAKEKQKNEHGISYSKITTDKNVYNGGEPIKITANFKDLKGRILKGSDAHVFARLVGPDILVAVLQDPTAEGTYRGTIVIPETYPPSEWKIFVYAQNVDQTKPGTAPLVAATNIGGFLLTRQWVFEDEPCQIKLKEDGRVTVAAGPSYAGILHRK